MRTDADILIIKNDVVIIKDDIKKIKADLDEIEKRLEKVDIDVIRIDGKISPIIKGFIIAGTVILTGVITWVLSLIFKK